MKTLILLLLLGRSLMITHTTYVPFEMFEALHWDEAQPYGATAILAHDWLEGQYFYDLKLGDTLRVVYADWTKQDYIITEYLIATGSDKTFYYVYGNYGHLVLTTCYKDIGNLYVIGEIKK